MQNIQFLLMGIKKKIHGRRRRHRVAKKYGSRMKAGGRERSTVRNRED